MPEICRRSPGHSKRDGKLAIPSYLPRGEGVCGEPPGNSVLLRHDNCDQGVSTQRRFPWGRYNLGMDIDFPFRFEHVPAERTFYQFSPDRRLTRVGILNEDGEIEYFEEKEITARRGFVGVFRLR